MPNLEPERYNNPPYAMKMFFFLSGFLLTLTGFAQTSDVYFASSPTLTPDGNTILFSYESDLWKVDINGGNATRLTAMQGAETRPRVSPDGQWLAFSATEGGNSDVYVMPLNGGPIRQLTFHSASDLVESWSWDSKTIYFESTQQNGGTTFTVARDRGYPAAGVRALLQPHPQRGRGSQRRPVLQRYLGKRQSGDAEGLQGRI